MTKSASGLKEQQQYAPFLLCTFHSEKQGRKKIMQQHCYFLFYFTYLSLQNMYTFIFRGTSVTCFMTDFASSTHCDNKTWPCVLQRWLLEKIACILATAHLHTAKKKLMFGLWSGKDLFPENCSSILLGQTPTSGWLFPRSCRSIMGYSCFSVGCVFWFSFLSKTSVDVCKAGPVLLVKLY